MLVHSTHEAAGNANATSLRSALRTGAHPLKHTNTHARDIRASVWRIKSRARRRARADKQDHSDAGAPARMTPLALRTALSIDKSLSPAPFNCAD